MIAFLGAFKIKVGSLSGILAAKWEGDLANSIWQTVSMPKIESKYRSHNLNLNTRKPNWHKTNHKLHKEKNKVVLRSNQPSYSF